jgi:hypothetical protein
MNHIQKFTIYICAIFIFLMTVKLNYKLDKIINQLKLLEQMGKMEIINK